MSHQRAIQDTRRLRRGFETRVDGYGNSIYWFCGPTYRLCTDMEQTGMFQREGRAKTRHSLEFYSSMWYKRQIQNRNATLLQTLTDTVEQERKLEEEATSRMVRAPIPQPKHCTKALELGEGECACKRYARIVFRYLHRTILFLYIIDDKDEPTDTEKAVFGWFLKAAIEFTGGIEALQIPRIN